MANNTKKKTVKPAAKPAETKPETKSGEIDELRAQIQMLQAQLANQKPQVVQVMADTEKVVLRFQAEVAKDCYTVFGVNGLYGSVTGKTGFVTVPKSEWSRFYNEPVQNLFRRRWLTVVSGLDESEMKAYGCDYKPGELLDEKSFNEMLDMGSDLLSLFPALCREHKMMVASRFLEAWRNGDPRVQDRDLIVKLNEMSRDEDAPHGMFAEIIRGLNEKDTKL